MLPIDRYAYNNYLNKIHPGEKFAFSVITMSICLLVSNIVISLAVICIMAGAVIFRAGIPARFYLKLLIIPVSFLVIGVFTVAISIGSSNQEYIYAYSIGNILIGVTGESLGLASNLFFKSLGAVSCLYFLSLTTPMVEIILVLKKLRVPSLFIEMMTLIYRFIFVLMDNANKMYTAQSCRLGYNSLKISFYSLGQLVSNLFVKAYKQSKDLSNALESRCYTGELNFLQPQYSVRVGNIIFIGAINIFLLTVSLFVGGNIFWLKI